MVGQITATGSNLHVPVVPPESNIPAGRLDSNAASAGSTGIVSTDSPNEYVQKLREDLATLDTPVVSTSDPGYFKQAVARQSIYAALTEASGDHQIDAVLNALTPSELLQIESHMSDLPPAELGRLFASFKLNVSNANLQRIANSLNDSSTLQRFIAATGVMPSSWGAQRQASDRVYADLAADVYKPDSTGVDGWTRLNAQQLSALGLNPAAFQDSSNTFCAALYGNGRGQYALVFRGTISPRSVDALKSWGTDIEQGVGLDAKQYDEAESLTRSVADRVGLGHLELVGHSLGGGLADAAAVAIHGSAVTFNAAGVSNGTLERLGVDPAAARRYMEQTSRNYAVQGEILTTFQEHAPGVPRAMGHEIVLPDPDPHRGEPPQVPSTLSTIAQAISPLNPVPRDAIRALDAPHDVWLFTHSVWLHSAYQEAIDKAG